MATSTVEDYLKCIVLEEERGGRERVPTGQIAQALAVTPGTATVMVKALAESGLVDYEAYEGVRLTPAGEILLPVPFEVGERPKDGRNVHALRAVRKLHGNLRRFINGCDRN